MNGARRFDKHILDQRAVEFLRQGLSNGHTLSNLLVDRLSWPSARTYCFVPSDATGDIYGFRYGFVARKSSIRAEDQRTSVEAADVRSLATGLIVSSFASTAGASCLLENWLARCTDRWIRKAIGDGLPIVCLRDEVYHHIPSNVSLAAATELVSVADTGGFTAVVSEVRLETGTMRELEKETLVEFSRAAFQVMMTAYDHDGLVVWESIGD